MVPPVLPATFYVSAHIVATYACCTTRYGTRWSNGQVEGQVNRVKLVKRSMYGRAGFALLRERVLRAA